MNAILHRQTRAVLIEGENTVARLAEVAVESGISLAYADLRNALLANAMLAGADLRRASLVGANLTGACLISAELDDADLTATDFTGAIFESATFVDANISYAKGLVPTPRGARRYERDALDPEPMARRGVDAL